MINNIVKKGFCSTSKKGTYFAQQAKELDYLMEKVYPMVQKYIKENDKSDTKVIEYHSPSDMQKLFPLDLPENPQSNDQVIESIEKLLKYSVRTAHPKFFNQLYAGTNPTGQISELINGVLNTNVHTYAVAPVMARMEVECIKATAEVFGYDVEKADGILNPGGTYSNMVAFMIARHKYFPHIRQEGIKSGDKPVSFCSPQAHYSIKRAAMMSGMGMDSVITPECNFMGDMKPEALDEAITKAKQQGYKPFFVNATAGTTVMGGYDNFVEIAKICKKHDVWMHIDGCHGGSFIFSEKYKHLMKGSELSDSIAINYHKMLSVPTQTCALVTNNHKNLLQQANASGAVYLFHKHEASEYDLGDKSLQCGRRSDAVKLWLCWQRYGNKGFGAQVDKAMENAIYFKEQLLKRSEKFHYIGGPMCTNVSYFYVPKAFRNYKNISEIYDKLNVITPLIYKRMQKRGNQLINYNPLNDQGLPYFFRIIFIQPSVEFHHIDEVLDEFEVIGENITEQDLIDHQNSLL